jgi:hypothetical protein
VNGPKIDWLWLAREVGSVEENRSVRGGTRVAQLALEKILGPANIREAVNLVLTDAPSAELVSSVLTHIHSAEATRLAYAAYKASTGQRARDAVGLIARIAHPMALAWVEEFVADENVIGWGTTLLDQLLWTHAVDPDDPEVQRLLSWIANHSDSRIREHATFMQNYLATGADAVRQDGA